MKGTRKLCLEVRFAVRNTSPQEMGKPWSAGTQIRKSAGPTVLRGHAQRKVGHRYLLHPHKRGYSVSVYDPGSVRQQYCSLQDSNPANRKSCSGHDPIGDEEREKESRRGVTAPQRPRFSIHLSSILQPNPILRHKAFHVKESLMTTRWQKISFRFSKQSASTGIRRRHSKMPII